MRATLGPAAVNVIADVLVSVHETIPFALEC